MGVLSIRLCCEGRTVGDRTPNAFRENLLQHLQNRPASQRQIAPGVVPRRRCRLGSFIRAAFRAAMGNLDVRWDDEHLVYLQRNRSFILRHEKFIHLLTGPDSDDLPFDCSGIESLFRRKMLDDGLRQISHA